MFQYCLWLVLTWHSVPRPHPESRQKLSFSKEWAVSKKTMTIHDPFVEKMMLWQLCLLVWYTRRFEVARRKERQPCLAFKRPVTLRKEHVLIQFRCALEATRHTPHDEDETQRNEDESQNQKVRHETHLEHFRPGADSSCVTSAPRQNNGESGWLGCLKSSEIFVYTQGQKSWAIVDDHDEDGCWWWWWSSSWPHGRSVSVFMATLPDRLSAWSRLSVWYWVIFFLESFDDKHSHLDVDETEAHIIKLYIYIHTVLDMD